MQDAQVIVLATPVFLGLIAVEMLVARRRGVAVWTLPDSLNSIGLGMLSQLVGLLTKVFTFGLYAWTWEHARLATLPASSWLTWVGALLAYDFC